MRVSNQMWLWGLQLGVCVKCWLCRGFVACITHKRQEMHRDNEFQSCLWMVYKPLTSLASLTAFPPPFLHTDVMKSVNKWSAQAAAMEWSMAVVLGRVQTNSIPATPLVQVFCWRPNLPYPFIHHPIIQDSNHLFSIKSFLIVLFSDRWFFFSDKSFNTATNSFFCNVHPFRLIGNCTAQAIRLL